mgnify:FL=1
MKQPAQSHFAFRRGFTPVVFIIPAVIVIIIIILVATGALKGNFSISRNKTDSQPTEESASVQTEPESQASKPTKSPELSETYTNESLNFQISHPGDWKPEQQGTNTSIYYTGEGATSSKGSKVAVVVTVEAMDNLNLIKLSGLVEELKKQVVASPNSTASETRATTLDGKEAYAFDLGITEGGEQFKGTVYVTADDKRVYTVTSLSEESKKAKLESTLDAIAKSFKIL